jgi:predicted transcriptional regulator of viral defense system
MACLKLSPDSVPRKRAFWLNWRAKAGRSSTVKDAYAYWDDDPSTPFRLRDLEEKGWLERLERGKYLIVPPEAPRP